MTYYGCLCYRGSNVPNLIVDKNNDSDDDDDDGFIAKEEDTPEPLEADATPIHADADDEGAQHG